MKRQRRTFQTGLPRDTAFTTSQKTAVLSVSSISEAAAQTLTGSRIFFIIPEFQGHGYGSEALSLIENIVKEYSESIYLEVAARNLRALKLYHKNGYTCLNTVTVRKDFEPDNFEVIEKNNIAGFDFEIKRYIKKGE